MHSEAFRLLILKAAPFTCKQFPRCGATAVLLPLLQHRNGDEQDFNSVFTNEVVAPNVYPPHPHPPSPFPVVSATDGSPSNEAPRQNQPGRE